MYVQVLLSCFPGEVMRKVFPRCVFKNLDMYMLVRNILVYANDKTRKNIFQHLFRLVCPKTAMQATRRFFATGETEISTVYNSGPRFPAINDLKLKLQSPARAV